MLDQLADLGNLRPAVFVLFLPPLDGINDTLHTKIRLYMDLRKYNTLYSVTLHENNKLQGNPNTYPSLNP